LQLWRSLLCFAPCRAGGSICDKISICASPGNRNFSSSKFSLLADVGIPEVWHYDLNGFSAFALVAAKYVPLTVSAIIAGLPLQEIASRIDDAVYTSDTGHFSKAWRKWLQENRHLHDPSEVKRSPKG
jgi:hypothetical protein